MKLLFMRELKELVSINANFRNQSIVLQKTIQRRLIIPWNGVPGFSLVVRYPQRVKEGFEPAVNVATREDKPIFFWPKQKYIETAPQVLFPGH